CATAPGPRPRSSSSANGDVIQIAPGLPGVFAADPRQAGGYLGRHPFLRPLPSRIIGLSIRGSRPMSDRQYESTLPTHNPDGDPGRGSVAADAPLPRTPRYEFLDEI